MFIFVIYFHLVLLLLLSYEHITLLHMITGIHTFLVFQNAVPSVTGATWQSLVLKADGPVLVEF